MEMALKISNLSKTYTGGVKALKDVSMQIAQGDFFALLGPNGAGKSTLIGVLSSLVVKSSGQIEIFGIDIDKNFSRAKELIGIVPQEFNFNIFESVEQIICNQAGYYGLKHHQIKDRLDFLLKQLALHDKRHTKSRSLSGGMKRRLMIARALIHNPKLLILDEPTAGVDIELRRSLWDFIRHINEKEKTTIILTTHYLEEAEQLAKNVAIINNGSLLVNTNVREFLRTLNSQTYVLDLVDALPANLLPTEMTHTSAEKLDEENSTNQLDAKMTAQNSSSFAAHTFPLTLGTLNVKILDTHTLEVSINKDENINQILSEMIAQNIIVQSIKPKEHKLEKLFIDLVRNDK